MSSIFTKIINGEIPCHKVAESDGYLAFLDIRPNAKGHTLVIPKVEVDYIFDLTDDQYLGLMKFAKQVAKAIQKTIECQRVGMLVIGTEVPHAHVHLIPFQKESQMNIGGPKLEFSQKEMAEIAGSVRQSFSSAV